LKRKRRKEIRSHYVAVWITEVEYSMVEKLREYWSKKKECIRSEVIRRCIVYTYIKFLKGEEIIPEVLEREYVKLAGYYYE
jgi:translation initiation factor IF-2